MPMPFYNAIRGTTTEAPGTGSYTPSGASPGFRPWHAGVPGGWIGLVRYEDVDDWELRYGFWDGITISRPKNGFVDSSTGCELNLSSSATAAVVVDAAEVMSHIGGVSWRGWVPVVGGSSVTAMGVPSPKHVGTAASATGALSAANYLTMQPRVGLTSGAEAGNQAGMALTKATAFQATSAFRGGYEFSARFGASTLPPAPKLFVGMTAASFISVPEEPSTFSSSYAAVAKDSTDTNIQFLVNSGSELATAIDTGIPYEENGWYEVTLWNEPSSYQTHCLLVRVDTGDIYHGSTLVNVPADGAAMFPQALSGLSGTAGTPVVFHVGSVFIRSGS